MGACSRPAPVLQATRTAPAARKDGDGAVSTAAASPVGELKRAYQKNGDAARIRLEARLLDEWRQNPPPVETVIRLADDASAPAEFRAYVLRAFGIVLKTTRGYAPETVAKALTPLVDAAGAPSLVRGQAAIVLLGAAPSTAAIQTVVRLLETGDDQAGAMAVTALRRSGTDEAAVALFSFLQQAPARVTTQPLTVAAGLSALCAHPRFDIQPILGDVMRGTDSEPVYVVVLDCLARSRSTPATVETIVAAAPLAARWQGSARAQSAAVRALTAHAQLIAAPPAGLTPGTLAAFARARQIMEGRQ